MDTMPRLQTQDYRHKARTTVANADTFSGLTHGHNARATDTELQTQC